MRYYKLIHSSTPALVNKKTDKQFVCAVQVIVLRFFCLLDAVRFRCCCERGGGEATGVMGARSLFKLEYIINMIYWNEEVHWNRLWAIGGTTERDEEWI